MLWHTEVLWIQNVLQELKIILPQAPFIFCDNFRFGALAKHPVLHSITKYVEVDFHFIQERVLNGKIDVKYTPTQEQIAYIMTYFLGTTHFQELCTKLTVMARDMSTREDLNPCNYTQSLL